MKVKLLALLLIGFLVTGCANKEEFPAEEITSQGSPLSLCYLSLNISSISDEGSRADGVPELDMKYGTESENYIAGIRFYFFNDEGEPVGITENKDISGTFLNYYDWSPGANSNGTTSGSESGSVEKEVMVTVPVLSDLEVYPTRLIAIVNPTEDIKRKEISSIEDLENIVSEFQLGLTDHNFVMSNSVYASSGIEGASTDFSVICPVIIDENDFYITRQEAEKNPVSVYVERIVARVDVAFSSSLTKVSLEGKNLFKVNTSNQNSADEDVYVEFLGWAVTSSPSESRLIKKIEPQWDQRDFFSATNSWNVPYYHRSLWAVNPETFEYDWFTFYDLIGKDKEGRDIGRDKKTYDVDVSSKMTIYTQENANPYNSGIIEVSSPSYSSKVIFAARLLDTEGNPITIAEYEAETYSLSGLKALIAGKLSGKMRYEDSPGHFSDLSSDDINFVTARQHNGEDNPDATGTFYVYYHLSENAANRIWYRPFTNYDEKENYKIQDANRYINELVFPAKIWNNGFTYYFFEIPHFTDDTGKSFPGVVRNFLYNATINKILSLGTPVYDPTERIYPENPPKTIPLDVTVKTLKWRIESQDVNFTW